MKRIVVAAACLVLAPVPMRAQTTATVYTFTTVDAVEAQPGKLVVTGVKGGETVATSLDVFTCSTTTDPKCSTLLENCERLALLAMAKPGQYLFKVLWASGWYTTTCKLERVAP